VIRLSSHISQHFLLEREKETQTSVESSQQIICSLVSCKNILIQDILPSLLFELILPESKEVFIIFLLIKVFLEVFGVTQIFKNSLIQLTLRALVACVFFIALLDHFGWGSETVKRQEVMSSVIVKAFAVVEYVVFLVTC
jgi:hypothetical protein